MIRISNIVNNLMGDISPVFSLKATLYNNWKNILCEDLLDVCELHDVVYTSKLSIKVSFNVLNSASMIIRCQENQIISNLQTFTGVKDIKLILKQVLKINKKIFTEPLKITNDKKPEFISTNFNNQVLKKALENLKTEIQDAA